MSHMASFRPWFVAFERAQWRASSGGGDRCWGGRKSGRRQGLAAAAARAILGWRYRALEERPKGAAGSWEGGEHGDVLRRTLGWPWPRQRHGTTAANSAVVGRWS